MALARLKGQQEGQKSSNQGCKKCGQMGHLSVPNMPERRLHVSSPFVAVLRVCRSICFAAFAMACAGAEPAAVFPLELSCKHPGGVRSGPQCLPMP